MMTREDLTFGGGHMVEYTDLVTQKPIPATYMIMLTHVTPIN